MNKNIRILALAVVLAGFAAPAFADGFQILALPRMKWVKGATTDSTEIATPFGSAGVAGADTTAWFDLSGFVFAQSVNGSSTAAALVGAQVNAQQAATLDTMRVTIQYANDITRNSGHFTAAAASVLVANTASQITVLDSDDAPAKWFRIIFENYDQSTGVTRKVSIVPVVKVAR